MAQVLDGRVIRDEIRGQLRARIAALNTRPTLVMVQVGDNPASNIYIGQKIKFGTEIGVTVRHERFGENVLEDELVAAIERYNRDEEVEGIIVQLPLPAQLEAKKILSVVRSEKDVDGLSGVSSFVPATTRGILTLLDYYQIAIAGKQVVMVGDSDLVGKPTAKALGERGATVTVANIETVDLAGLTREADVIVSATGVPKLIGAGHVRSGQVVIDVGVPGDVDFLVVSEIVAAITPVPGGVGPLTVASLFANLLDATFPL